LPFVESAGFVVLGLEYDDFCGLVPDRIPDSSRVVVLE